MACACCRGIRSLSMLFCIIVVQLAFCEAFLPKHHSLNFDVSARNPVSTSRIGRLRLQDQGSLTIDIDLGDDGEPKGRTPIKFTPVLPRSEIFQVDLRLPLGMLIEVEEDGSGSVAGMWYQKTRVVVADALPGFSAHGNVKKGDILRAVTAYRTVIVAPEGFSVWKQLTSYSPVGSPELRRLIFRCEGAEYGDVRDAIQSHREGNSIVTVVIERPIDDSAVDDRESTEVSQ
mmetsp:Transcript_2625/g.5544  ORF Transcript_2625/g.5544 Transcript_2625/m.5544 type:complete len:231 (+) Transcript_2625:396-1088(+)|eukprot:1260280-Pleurochrysis_carterae.AAC.6